MTHDPQSSPAPAGIYLHFPSCARLCSYCGSPTVIGNAAGRIVWDNSRIRLTSEGRIRSNGLFSELIAA